MFDPPGKAAEPCFSLEMSTHLLGKASSTLSCFLVFPKACPTWLVADVEERRKWQQFGLVGNEAEWRD